MVNIGLSAEMIKKKKSTIKSGLYQRFLNRLDATD